MVEMHWNIKLKTKLKAGRDFRAHLVLVSLFKERYKKTIDNLWMIDNLGTTHKVLN